MTDFNFDRRTFLRRGAMGAGALWALSLNPFMARRAEGAAIVSPYGPISAKIDETTGLPLIMLPDGFRYMSLRLDRRPDGGRCPLPEPARRHGGRRRGGELGTGDPRSQP